MVEEKLFMENSKWEMAYVKYLKDYFLFSINH
jgi:hypothetical protein